MQSNAYCTYGVESPYIQELSCPAQRCYDKVIVHRDYTGHRFKEEWPERARRVNCKVVFKADSSLAGNLIVDVIALRSVSLNIIKVPNQLDGGKVGLTDDYSFNDELRPQRYEVEPDWTIIIQYQQEDGNALIKVNSWVEEAISQPELLAEDQPESPEPLP